MPDTYARQRALDLTTPPNVTVVGCGGVGCWVAIDAAMSGVGNIFLFDPDTIDESNRNRLPFCSGSINRPKVDVVREFIMAIREDAIVVAIKEKLEGVLLEIQLTLGHIIIDCTDSPRAQLNIHKACVNRGIPYIRAGYDGTHMTVTSNVSGWIRNEEEETYTITPSWVVPAQVVAALAVGKMMKFTNQEVSLDIGEIGIPVLQRRRRVTARCAQRG